MTADFQAYKPSEIKFSLTITMSIKEWLELQAQLDGNYPSWQLSNSISDMVTQAQKTFYPKVIE